MKEIKMKGNKPGLKCGGVVASLTDTCLSYLLQKLFNFQSLNFKVSLLPQLYFLPPSFIIEGAHYLTSLMVSDGLPRHLYFIIFFFTCNYFFIVAKK